MKINSYRRIARLFPVLKTCNLNAKREIPPLPQSWERRRNLTEVSLRQGEKKIGDRGNYRPIYSLYLSVKARSLHCSFSPNFTAQVMERDVGSFWWDNCSLWCLTAADPASQRRLQSETIVKMSFMTRKVCKEISDELTDSVSSRLRVSRRPAVSTRQITEWILKMWRRSRKKDWTKCTLTPVGNY